jgi:acyl-CoA thioester hydrolase
MEVHVNYLNELTVDAPVAVSFQLIDHDAKRLHFFQTMTNSSTGELAATSEQLAMHVDMEARRSSEFPTEVQERITALAEAHAGLPAPEQLGRVIGIRKRA